jgi:putative ABC transport system ATP-binding protein
MGGDRVSAALVLDGVTRRYRGRAGDRVVLNQVSLAVGAGELVAVVGPSGAGKTTLLRIAGTLDQPDEGQVQVAGRSLGAIDERELERLRRHDLAFIFQAGNLLDSLTARENVELSLEGLGLDARERQRRVEEALSRLDVAALADRFPHEMSAGEQQRTAVARALARRPRLILCDEPTAHLDEESAARLADALVGLCAAGSACLLATHDLQVARRAHRALRLRAGALLAATSEELDVAAPG